MYIEASFKAKGSFAVLKSTSTTFRAGAWLSFQYHMFGARIGTLEVTFVEGSKKKLSLWKKTSNKGNKWHLADIDLSPIVGKTGEIWLTGTIARRCAQFLGDTAIDEVALTTGSAGPTPAPAPGASSGWFDRIDADNNGKIKRDEMNKAVTDGTLKVVTPGAGAGPAPTSAPTPAATQAPAPGTKAAPSSASAVFHRIDTDKSGNIKSDEFNKALANGILKVPR